MLAQFDENDGPVLEWVEKNDPVMGGKSTGDFTVRSDDGVGLFFGEVVDVPFLKAPGFIQASARASFPDVSGCGALKITCRSLTDYQGYKIAFGNKRGPIDCSFYSTGYKTALDAPTGDEFGEVIVPFDQFSNCNSDGTGLPIRTCEDDPKVCPDEKTLEDVKMITVWGEGVAGKVDLEIKTIEAIGCGGDDDGEEEEDSA